MSLIGKRSFFVWIVLAGSSGCLHTPFFRAEVPKETLRESSRDSQSSEQSKFIYGPSTPVVSSKSPARSDLDPPPSEPPPSVFTNTSRLPSPNVTIAELSGPKGGMNEQGPTLQAVSSPPNVEAVSEALQCIIENRHNEALKLLQKYDPATQEVLLRFLPTLALLAQTGLEQLSPEQVNSVYEQLRTEVLELRSRAELVIDRMCFCDDIKGFGNYRPLPDGHTFRAEAPNRLGEEVQVYFEVRNFTAEMRGNEFVTRLTGTAEILDAAGKQVWSYRLKDADLGMRRRTMVNDYFYGLGFLVPSLPAGTYTLALRLTDETRADAKRDAHKSLDFRVGPTSH